METTNNNQPEGVEKVFVHRSLNVFASHNLKMVMAAEGMFEFLQTLTLEVSILPLPDATYQGITFTGEAFRVQETVATVMMFLADNKGIKITADAPEGVLDDLVSLNFKLKFNSDFFVNSSDEDTPLFQGVMSVPASSPENDGGQAVEYDVSITFTVECTLTLFDR